MMGIVAKGVSGELPAEEFMNRAMFHVALLYER
jgi:hypothetical protein